jgi:hypothetical protein
MEPRDWIYTTSRDMTGRRVGPQTAAEFWGRVGSQQP